MLACAASVKAIDDWPERAYASSPGLWRRRQRFGPLSKRNSGKIPNDYAGKTKEPMALNHRPFHKSYRNKFNPFLNLALNFVKLNFSSHSGWNHNRSWNGIPAT